LLESESDLKILRKLADNDQFSVEANDMGAVHLLTGRLPFVIGPHINVYNSPALSLLAETGAKRWVMPVEMSRGMLHKMQLEKPANMETEVFAFGRLPLAFSARCFTARHHNLPKDDCQFRCLDYANGLTLNTREGQPFLVLNGIQTQSASVYNLINELVEMNEMGVNIVRISPQAWHTTKIIEQFWQSLNNPDTAQKCMQQLAKWMPDKGCDGYWHGKAGLEQSTGITAQ
ncbi:U32 family peptidase, partial [Sulfurirhabdus autotrophica]